MATKEQRIAIIGDVHGNFGALTAALADAEEQHVTDYIVLGDITNRGPEPERCLRALRQLHPLAWVLGNHEEVYTSLLAHRFTDFDGNSKAVMAIVTSNYDRQRMTADEFRWLAARPLQQNVTVAGVRVSIFHATPDKCRGHYTEPTAPQDHFDHVLAGNNADLAFCGHTHQPVVRRTTDGRYVINPGSVGQSTTSWPRGEISRACYGILSVADGSVGGWTQRYVPYDAASEADLAGAQNVPYAELYQRLITTGEFKYTTENVAAINARAGLDTVAHAAIANDQW